MVIETSGGPDVLVHMACYNAIMVAKAHASDQQEREREREQQQQQQQHCATVGYPYGSRPRPPPDYATAAADNGPNGLNTNGSSVAKREELSSREEAEAAASRIVAPKVKLTMVLELRLKK